MIEVVKVYDKYIYIYIYTYTYSLINNIMNGSKKKKKL